MVGPMPGVYFFLMSEELLNCYFDVLMVGYPYYLIFMHLRVHKTYKRNLMKILEF